jgi:hypothetical protein
MTRTERSSLKEADKRVTSIRHELKVMGEQNASLRARVLMLEENLENERSGKGHIRSGFARFKWYIEELGNRESVDYNLASKRWRFYWNKTKISSELTKVAQDKDLFNIAKTESPKIWSTGYYITEAFSTLNHLILPVGR